MANDFNTDGYACRVVDLKKEYVLKSETVRALRGVTFDVPIGDYVAIMGPSGSGKSTLLNLLGCLDQPTAGSLWLGHDDVAKMTDDQLADVRSQRIGFVFQAYNLIQQLTVVENIQVPLFYQGKPLTAAQKTRSIELAKMVGLGERLDHRPTQLSGGQQQRVAIARSLVNALRKYFMKYFLSGARVEVSSRFVSKDKIRVVDQRSGDRNTLLLTTGELSWTVIESLA